VSIASTHAVGINERIRTEQLRVLFQTAPVAMLAAWVAALMLGVTVWFAEATPTRAVGIWLLCVGADAVWRQALCFAWRRDSQRDARSALWAWRFRAACFAGGWLWGLGAVVLIQPGMPVQELMVLLVISAVASGSVPTFGAYLPAALAFFLPSMLPYTLWTACQHDPMHWGLAALSTLYMAILVWLCWRTNADLANAIRLRFDNQTLAENLARQKTEVEAASLAKSRFLAAASHDLRQPVHAIGLFIGALRRTELTPDASELLEHVEASARGLDHLFAALLDISRLDAGVVEANPRRFAAGPLIVRLCREFRAEAEAKGLDLRCRPTALWVEADPLLTERVLRNFLSNAIRYTEVGGVLVGVRCGGDAQVRLVVADTGCGIAASQREKIFEEFFQLGNPERDRRQGLGLGLAIARRLAVLMGRPLTLASVPGRGSTFALALPQASPDASAPQADAARALAGRFIVVVDDEIEIQRAMRELLVRWGHRVLTAGSGDELVAALVSEPAVPDLILADYRLRDGENGLDLVERLREEYNVEIPALILTGDTAPERLLEALERGHRLLHKPVRPYALERALAEALGSIESA
jgi:signal transduction histidine kinase/CheY-like chemotaxis protein